MDKSIPSGPASLRPRNGTGSYALAILQQQNRCEVERVCLFCALLLLISEKLLKINEVVTFRLIFCVIYAIMYEHYYRCIVHNPYSTVIKVCGFRKGETIRPACAGSASVRKKKQKCPGSTGKVLCEKTPVGNNSRNSERSLHLGY